MPPANDVPPMTAAEITSSSFWTPRFVTAGVEAGGLDRRADRAQDAHQDERHHDRPAHVDAAELGGVGVAADREHVAAEPPPGREVGHDEADAEHDQDRDGDAGRDDQAARRPRDPVLLGALAVARASGHE